MRIPEQRRQPDNRGGGREDRRMWCEVTDRGSVDVVQLLQQTRQLMPVVQVTSTSRQSSPRVSDGRTFQKVLGAAPERVSVLSGEVVERVTTHAHSTDHLHAVPHA